MTLIILLESCVKVRHDCDLHFMLDRGEEMSELPCVHLLIHLTVNLIGDANRTSANYFHLMSSIKPKCCKLVYLQF